MRKRGKNRMAAILGYLGKHAELGEVTPFFSPDSTCITVRELAEALGITRYRSEMFLRRLHAGQIPKAILPYIDSTKKPLVILVWATSNEGGKVSRRLLVDALTERGRERVEPILARRGCKGERSTDRFTVRVPQETGRAVRSVAKQLGVSANLVVGMAIRLLGEGAIKAAADEGKVNTLGARGGKIAVVISGKGELSVERIDSLLR
jgi:hypothetical protein